MTKTIAVLIGNSDNRLPQNRWCDFCESLRECAEQFLKIHFSAPSAGDSEYQNYCVVGVFEGDEMTLRKFREALAGLRYLFQQESIAVVIGETKFLCG